MRAFAMGVGAGAIAVTALGGLVIALTGNDGVRTVPEDTTTDVAVTLARLDRIDAALAALSSRVDSAVREPSRRGAADSEVAAPTALPSQFAPALARIDERLAAIEAARTQLPELAERVAAVETHAVEVASALGNRSAAAASPFAEIETSALLSRAKVLSNDPEQALTAVEAYQDLLARNLTDSQRRRALESVASLYFAAEDYDAAARSYAGALELMDPRSRDALGRAVSLGHSLLRSGDLRDAIDVFKRQIAHPHRTNISEANARSSIASCWRQLGETERARLELQTIIDRFELETESVMKQYVASARRRISMQ